MTEQKEKLLIYIFIIVFITIGLFSIQSKLISSLEQNTINRTISDNIEHLRIIKTLPNKEEIVLSINKKHNKTIVEIKENINLKDFTEKDGIFYKQENNKIYLTSENILLIKDISEEIAFNKRMKSEITIELILIIFSIIIAFIFYQFFFKERLEKEKRTLKNQLEDLSSDYDKYIISSKTDLRGNITFVSKAFEEISGYTKDELLGQSHSIIKHEDTNEEIFKEMWSQITKGIPWEGILKNKRKDGSHYFVKSVVSPVFNKKGKITGYSSIRYDISSETEYSLLNCHLEELIKEKDIMLISKTKLAQMGELIAMIAHQWRQPLSAIVSTTNTLKIKIIRDKYEKEYFEEKIEEIANYAKHLSETINDFRNFYKVKKEKEETSLANIAKNALKIIGSSLENNKVNLIIEFNCNKGLKTYSNEVQQVVLNLIKNAEDSLLQNNIKNPTIKIKTFEKNGSFCILEVLDNGIGISEKIKDKIFDPYFTTKENLNGTGLGLYMSKTIIEDHCHGKIETDKENEFTVFRIILPKDF